MHDKDNNIDQSVVSDFGIEWARFQQDKGIDEELQDIFENQYFKIFPWDLIGDSSLGADIGCGSGRWAKFVSERVGHLLLVDASSQALSVAKNNLSDKKNVDYFHASVDALPIESNQLDFAYSLGVLHHVPDTAAAIASVVEKLKPGAPFLLYLYYAFDNRPYWYRLIWKTSELLRSLVSRMPSKFKVLVCEIIALLVYFPLARLSKLLAKVGLSTGMIPLSAYADLSFYTMRTDALDRFGTRLEQRFTRRQIKKMMEDSGLIDIKFSNSIPFWVVIGYKA